ncbi:MAG: hypothetical protein OIF48_11960, partial [Silicimonas sp.]|nr:hypothetical protein [Silicimonas sp.]
MANITGNNQSENIPGTNDDDFISGLGGNDTISGLGGDDGIDGGAGNDSIDGGSGYDYIFAGPGNDTFRGGGNDEDDELTYENAASGVTVNLATGLATNDGDGGTDVISDIVRIRGSAFNDNITADGADRNRLIGLAGNDTLNGGDGERDEVRYSRDADYGGTGGVTVNLATGIAIDGFGDTDTLINIERVDGTNGNDTILGDDNRNNFKARDGNDSLFGAGDDDWLQAFNGNDTLNGGDGFDGASWLEQSEAAGATGVNANLLTGIAIDAFGFTDTLISIEELEGTFFNDTLIGDNDDNNLQGEDGNDSLVGNGGRDFFRPGEGDDFVDGGSQPNSYDGDRVRYGREHENGGTQGIVVNLANGTATDTFGDTDTLINIEEVVGSFFNDTIIGNGDDNYLEGNQGNDSLV